MKKFLTLFTALLVAGSMLAADVTITLEDYAGFSFTTDEGITLSAAKNSGSTEPTYNTTGKDVRVYAKGTVTLSATKDITAISFVISAQGKKRLAPLTASVGSVSVTNAPSATWEGSAKEVTFTVGDKADYGTESTKAGQLCFTAIEVTLASDEGGGDSGDDPEPGDTYTVAGSSLAAFGSSWDVTDTDNDMIKQDDGTYKWEKSGIEVAEDVKFKVAVNHSWDEAYPSDDYVLAITESGSYTITITFDPDSKAVEASAEKQSGDDSGEGVHDATMAKGTTNSYDDNTINGKSSIKIGKSGAGGNMTITVGAGANKLSFYAAAWKGEGADLTLAAPEGVTVDPESITLTPNDNLSGSGKAFTIDNEESYKFAIALSNVSAETAIEVTSAKRAFVWGATYTVGSSQGGEGGDDPEPALDYYVCGTMTGWAANADYKLAVNPSNAGEYMGEFTFEANAEFKVVYSDGEAIDNENWFPQGANNNFVISDAGDYTIYFRPDGQGGEDWHEGYIYAQYHAPLSDPTNCAEAAEAALSVENNNEPYNNGKEYTIVGYVTSIATAYSEQHHDISFWMADEADGGNVLEAYRVACETKDDAPNVGDKVAVTGQLTKYNTTPEFAAGCTVEIKERVAAPENLGEKTIAEFLELKNFKDTCELTGKVTNISSTKYGNFDLMDNTGKVYVYGLLTPSGEQQKFAELDVEVNDTITIKAVYYEYNESPQAYNAVFKEIVRKAVYSIAGAEAIFGDNWNEKEGNEMTRQDDGTYKLVLNDVELAASTYEYKVVVNHAWNNGEAGTNSALEIETSGLYNITFTYNPTTTETSAVARLIEEEEVIPSVQIAATFNNWAPADLILADDKQTASITYSLQESSVVDSLKLLIATNWKGNGASLTRQNNTVNELNENTDNILLDVDQTGDYTFTWTFEGNILTVSYPELVIDNCAKAAKAAMSVSGNNVPYNNGQEYTLRGYVTAIATSYKPEYGNMTFWMADTKDGGQVLEAFYVIPESADELPIVGDFVEVTGQLTKYNKIPEFASGSKCKIIEKSDNPRNLGEKTIAEFLALQNPKDTCILTGEIVNIIMDQTDPSKPDKRGKFDLVDETGKVYVYGLLTAEGVAQQFQEMGIETGDTLTIMAVYYENNGKPEAKDAVLVSVKKGTKPVNLGEVTIAEFLEMKNLKDTCILTGIVANMMWEDEEKTIPNRYGNFDLADADNPELSVFIYGLLTADGQEQMFQEMGIEEGDTLTLKGVYVDYFGKAEISKAVFISVKKLQVSEPETIEINAPTSIQYRDAVATDGWWLMVGEDEKLSFKLSNINEITEAPGTYTAEELDPAYAFIIMQSAPEDTIRFTDGEIVLDYEIRGIQDVTTVKGTLVGEDGNNYVFNIEFGVDMPINYYLVGSFNNWEPSVDYQFKVNPYAEDEYKFTTNLTEGDQFKVVAIQGEVETWYPDGQNNDYTVDADHAGEVTIYFRPKGNEEWEAFHEGGFFYIGEKLEPKTIDIELTENVSYEDNVATAGWWNIYGSNDIYYVQVSNINTTEAEGTYTFEELDANWTHIEVLATEANINFVDGSVTLSIDETTGAIIVEGQLIGNDDNTYNIRLVYTEPKAENTVELNIEGYLRVESETEFMFGGTDEATNIYVQLGINSENIEGTYTMENVNTYVSAVYFEDDTYTDFFTAEINIVRNNDGSYTATAELLCYNNTMYVVTINAEADETTGVDNIRAARLYKYIMDGRLIIERDGVRYDITGQMIR